MVSVVLGSSSGVASVNGGVASGLFSSVWCCFCCSVCCSVRPVSLGRCSNIVLRERTTEVVVDESGMLGV